MAATDKTNDGKDLELSDLENSLDREATLQPGEVKFHKLGWKQLTICLIVEAIALGSLSIPSAFASVGMVAGVILTVGLGFVVSEFVKNGPAFIPNRSGLLSGLP